MTEPTIAEVFDKYPHIKIFIDKDGNEWERLELILEQKHNRSLYFHKNYFKYCSIPGLRPKLQKHKVTINGWATDPSQCFITFYKDENNPPNDTWKKATITYETDTEQMPVKQLSRTLITFHGGMSGTWLEGSPPLKGIKKYRVTFTEMEE